MVGIIILNYNTWNETVKCIKSILFKNSYLDFKIYLVDNASPIQAPKDVLTFLTKHTNRISFIRSKVNGGYNSGNNIGMERAIKDNCDYILISNNDIKYGGNSIGKMVSFLEKNPEVGIVGPKIMLSDGQSQEINMLIPTTLSGKYKYILRKTPLKFLTTSYVKRFSASEETIHEPLQVSSVSGACFLMTNKCAQKIYPLDSFPFLYEEEIILGEVTRSKGITTFYDPNIIVWHKQGASTGGMNGFAFTEFVRSEVYFCKKYLNATTFSLFPLYSIRCLEFILKSVYNKDYRRESVRFFSRTLKVFKQVL